MPLSFASNLHSGSLRDNVSGSLSPLNGTRFVWRGDRWTLLFDGVNDFFAAPYIPPFGTGDFTVILGINASWFNAQGGYNVLLGANTGSLFLYIKSTGIVSVGISGGAEVLLSTTALSLNRDYSIIYSRVSGVGTLYINGVANTTGANTQNYTADNSVFGLYGTNMAFKGGLYSFRVFSNALTQPEIDIEYSKSLSLKCAIKPTFGFYYPKPVMINGDGIVCAHAFVPKGTLLTDLSGNNRDLTLSGYPLVINEGQSFDGVNDKATGNIGTNIRSITMRIKLGNTSAKICEGGANARLIHANSGVLTATDFANKYVDGVSGTTLTTDWHTIVLTNATDVDFSAFTLGLNNATYGAFKIADLRFYSRVLTALEIANYHDSFVKPMVIEDFSSSAIGNSPTGWTKTVLTFSVAELAISTAIGSVYLPKGQKYIVSNAAATFTNGLSQTASIYFACKINMEGYMSYDLLLNGIWSRFSGKASELLTNNNWLTYNQGKLTFTAQGGVGITNIQFFTATASEQSSLWYGVSWDITATSPTLTRTGNLALHVSLPIQSLMKGCLKTDAGAFNYYLKSDDWSKKADGTGSNLDGTDGQVMVEIPTFYIKYIERGNISEIRVSQYPLTGYRKINQFYQGAYKAALQRSNLKLASVVNMGVDYRGGNNQNSGAILDTNANSLLGKPASSISRTNFRTYATNRGSKYYLTSYEDWKAVYSLYLVEYASRNCQLAVNNNLTIEGYRQGGLGAGVTTLVAADWLSYYGGVGYFSTIPCGTSNSLGNASGDVTYAIPSFPGASGTVKVPRYRGIENPFGDIWQWMDGINIYHQTALEGGSSLVYVIYNRAHFVDTLNVNNVLVSNRMSRAAGYIKTVIGGSTGELIANTVGGSDVAYWSDYNYENVVTNAGLRAPFVGGHAYSGADAGFGNVNSYGGASGTYSTLGGRLSCVS